MQRRADTKVRRGSTKRGEGRGEKDGESNTRTHTQAWRLHHLCWVECVRDAWAKA